MNLHKQMHVQHNCVNPRVRNFGRLCWKMSVVVQNGQWGSIFNPMGSKASLMVLKHKVQPQKFISWKELKTQVGERNDW